MRRTSLAFVAVATTLLAATASAQTTVTIYGRLDAGFDITRTANGREARVVSGGYHASRFGFQGSEDLGGGLRAVFRLEQGINVDDGTLGQGGRVFGREANVGLASERFGTVTLGRNLSSYFATQPWIDAFFWTGTGGMLALTRNASGGSQQILGLAANGRFDNSVAYVSPRIANLVFRAQLAAGEGSPAFGRGFGTSLRYTAGPLDVMTSLTRQAGAGNTNGAVRAFLVGGSYDFRVAKVYAGYTNETNDCGTCTGAIARAAASRETDFRLINLGVRVPFGNYTGLAQAVRLQNRSTYTAGAADRDGTWLSVGGEYALSKRTGLQASVGTIGNRNGSNYVLGTGAAQQPATVAAHPRRTTTASFNITHVF